MWFDSHSHISEAGDQDAIGEIVRRAREAEVVGIVVLGTDAASSRRAVDATALDGVWAGAAFHPTTAEGWTDAWIDQIAPMMEERGVVAVGETGIDLYWDRSYLSDQEAAFRAHIELAKEADKALVIHTRDSVDETIAILESEEPPPRLVFHCWSGTPAQMERALDLGSYISFAGNVSFKKATDLRDAAALVPGDRLLVETDSPYLAPEPKRGRENEPAFVPYVGDAVAGARGEPVDVVAASTTANARRLFGLES